MGIGYIGQDGDLRDMWIEAAGLYRTFRPYQAVFASLPYWIFPCSHCYFTEYLQGTDHVGLAIIIIHTVSNVVAS
jgi:hypothetical protein